MGAGLLPAVPFWFSLACKEPYRLQINLNALEAKTLFLEVLIASTP